MVKKVKNVAKKDIYDIEKFQLDQNITSSVGILTGDFHVLLVFSFMIFESG